MKRFLTHVCVFLVILLVLAFSLDWVVTSGLRKTEADLFAEWNAIAAGEAESDLLIQGSSRAWVHFSPSIIGSRLGMTCYNLGLDGYHLDMQLARYALYREHSEKPRVIVQSLDRSTLVPREGIYQPRQFLPFLDESAIRDAVRSYHYFAWYDFSLPLVRFRGEPVPIAQGALERLGIRHYTNDKDRGYQGIAAEWSSDLSAFIQRNPDGVYYDVSQEMVDMLDGFLARCEEEGVLVILVYPPEYIEAQKLPSNRDEVLETYSAIAARHGVVFLDYSRDPICYDTKYFYNSQHMNKRGAELFSREFAEVLARIVDTPTETCLLAP